MLHRLTSRLVVVVPIPIPVPVLVLLVLFGLACPVHAACQVWNSVGDDVTAAMMIQESVVMCQGDLKCENYTITDCSVVKCIGNGACFQATMKNIGTLVECQQSNSCHRATVHFADIPDIPDTTTTTTTTTNSNAIVQSMTCQGEDACNVAEIMGESLQLECFGRKACRKINARVDSVHCTHGTQYSEACTEYARLQANCILCGYLGCESHVNHCGTKPLDAPEDYRWKACLPQQPNGDKCTPQQIQALENEIATDGQIMGSQELDTTTTTTTTTSSTTTTENNEDNGGSK